MFDKTGDWEQIAAAAEAERRALDQAQETDRDLGETREWARAKKAARLKRSPIVVGAFVLVIVIMSLMAALIALAYTGFRIEILSHLWTPWPSDQVKLALAAIVIFGCVAVLVSEPKGRAQA